jgi:hypothetical protein
LGNSKSYIVVTALFEHFTATAARDPAAPDQNCDSMPMLHRRAGIGISAGV